jgi:hypothetical protein
MAVSSPDLKAFLLATPFFGGLSDASLDLLVSMLVERHFDVGATVVAEGEPGRSMFIVHSGKLVVSKLGDSGRAIRMAGLDPGDFFGEMTLIEMQNRSASVVAETLHVLQGRHPRLCDRTAEYQPRALPAAPPRRPPDCRTASHQLKPVEECRSIGSGDREGIFGPESARAGTARARPLAAMRFRDRLPRTRLLRGRPRKVSDERSSKGVAWRE